MGTGLSSMYMINIKCTNNKLILWLNSLVIFNITIRDFSKKKT